MTTTKKILALVSLTLLSTTSGSVFADSKAEHKHKRKHKPGIQCPVRWKKLTRALKNAVDTSAAFGNTNGGFGLNMWATVVNTEGKVCAVTKSGKGINAQWLGSRVISAQKANTANAFSLQNYANNALDGLALSTANLWAATQPGGSLFGLQFSNPVDTKWAYHGNARRFGTPRDPMKGRRVGGVNVFGGGLALYNADGKLVGAVGVSGDSSCADHNIAWRVRDGLGLDYVPAGVGSPSDNIIYDVAVDPITGLGVSASGFGHVDCGHNEAAANLDIVTNCPTGDGSNDTCKNL